MRTIRLILACTYLSVLVIAPVVLVFQRAFQHGAGPFLDAVTQPDALHALRLTLLATGVAVASNTVFGVVSALLIVRRPRPIAAILDALVDLPFAVSPVVAGLALVLTWGAHGLLGPWFIARGISIIYAPMGIVLATVFVTVPFVVREVVPVLRETGDEQEQAAATLGAGSVRMFLTITLPSIRWGVAYGVVLTAARALGEYGAVAVVSGRIAGRTETMTTYIDARWEQFDSVGTYAVSVVLALVAVLILLLMSTVAGRSGYPHDN